MSECRLTTPLGDEVRKLRIGDVVYITGTLITARDAAHGRVIDLAAKGEKPPVDFRRLALYHCGPMVQKTEAGWKVISAGPTTSTRMEEYESRFMETTGVRLIIGKGGMGNKTAEACKRLGAAYTIFTGGAGALAAKYMKVVGVEWLDLGMPEALWILEVDRFGPLTVIIDSLGQNYYEQAKLREKPNLDEAYKIMGIGT